MGYDVMPWTIQFTIVQVSGSCLNNQKKDKELSAAGGIGVFFAPNHKLNLSEPLHVGRQTNQRAVLVAAYRALKKAKQMKVENLIVQTNSKYLVENMNKNIHRWRKTDYISRSRRPVVNGDDFRRIDDEIQQYFRFVLFEYVAENEQAHSLAVEGAKKKRLLSLVVEE